MAKLIKAYKDSFTIVDNEIFKDQRLSYKELGLLCQMLSLPNNWNFSVAGLAVIHKDGTDSIKAGVKKLEEYGYLTRKRSRDESGLYTGNDYLIYQNPSDNPGFHPLVENPPVENPPVDKPSVENPSEDNPPAENPMQYSTKEFSTQESSTIQSIKDLLSMYESDSESSTDNHSEEEIMSWNDEDFYSHLNRKEYEAFVRLLEASIKGEIRSSKESLIEYFKKMKAKGWKDSYGKPIKTIEGYVRMNFDLHAENQKHKRNRRKDVIPVYDDSKNPPFDEEKYSRIMRERNSKEDK